MPLSDSHETSLTLGQRLGPLLAQGFFKPLSRPSCSVYVDCAERLAQAADEGGQVPFHEARLLIRDVLTRHPDVVLDEDEGGQFRDLNQRAGQFFNKLLEAHWFEPRRVNLNEHYILVAPGLRHLLRLFYDLAEDRPAELKDFAATLRSLCRDLLSDGALDPNKLGPEEMRQTVKELVDRSSRAEDQMHAVERLILEHETAQRGSDTAQETLQRFLIEFHSGEHMLCYDALQEAGLLQRILQARSIVQEALYDPFTKQRLAEGLASHLGIEKTAAYTKGEEWLSRLDRSLGSIPVKQRLIDGRMADFSRLSAARYRYQTELRGRRPEQIKSYMDSAAATHAGKLFSHLASEPGMDFLCPKAEIFYGTDSLARIRKQRAAADLTLKPVAEAEAGAAGDEIRKRNLNLLTPQRAARFIERHLEEKGTALSTGQLHLLLEDDLLDLLSVLAFDRGPATGSHRIVRWKIKPERGNFCTDPATVPRDLEAGRWMERFTLERIT
jgi:hypothetical protein